VHPGGLCHAIGHIAVLVLCARARDDGLPLGGPGDEVGVQEYGITCCTDTRRSVFLGANLVSWDAKRQPVVARSSAEAEYRVVANGVAKASWMRQLLHELHMPLQRATLVYYDNVSAVYLSSNPVQHQRTKHVEIDLHFVHEPLSVTFGFLVSPCSLTSSPRGYRRVYF
jgi:hypothetical protein